VAAEVSVTLGAGAEDGACAAGPTTRSVAAAGDFPFGSPAEGEQAARTADSAMGVNLDAHVMAGLTGIAGS
jgi:hypothetical protein